MYQNDTRIVKLIFFTYLYIFRFMVHKITFPSAKWRQREKNNTLDMAHFSKNTVIVLYFIASVVVPFQIRSKSVSGPFLRMGGKWDLHRTCLGGRRELHWNQN